MHQNRCHDWLLRERCFALQFFLSEVSPFELHPNAPWFFGVFFDKIYQLGARFLLLASAWQFEMTENASCLTRKWRIRAGIEPNATTGLLVKTWMLIGCGTTNPWVNTTQKVPQPMFVVAADLMSASLSHMPSHSTRGSFSFFLFLSSTEYFWAGGIVEWSAVKQKKFCWKCNGWQVCTFKVHFTDLQRQNPNSFCVFCITVMCACHVLPCYCCQMGFPTGTKNCTVLNNDAVLCCTIM